MSSIVFVDLHFHIYVFYFFCNGGKASVYAFVRFPRGCAAKAVSFNADNKYTELLRYDIEFPTNISAMDLDMLDNLVNYQRKVSIDSKVCDSFLFL